MRALVVIPTYNEIASLERVVSGVLSAADDAHLDLAILVVDDASPDGTGALADRLAITDPRVEVLHRPEKGGLGPAYRAGFAWGLERGFDALCEMDADGSHDPADVPRLLVTLRGADLVLGSRYVPGGGVTDWGPVRRAISRGGCIYAQAILRVPVRDLTGGFKCFRRQVLETLDLDVVHADGYGFQIEMTYRAMKAGFHVREVPIVFRDREVGTSKMNWRIAVEAVWKVPALKARLR